MEQKTVKKGKLKRRILRNIFIVWCCVMIVSSAAGFWYFRNIVRKQVVKDEQVKLEQLDSQMEFIREDVDNFTKIIAADEEIQSALTAEMNGDVFEQVKRKDIVAKRLSFFDNFRPYIAGAFLESAKGERFISSSDSNSAEHIEWKFSTKEIIDFRKDIEAVFSSPYYGVDNWSKEKKLICYRSFIYNPYSFGEKLGTIYVEIYLDYFVKLLNDYHDTWLVDGQDEVLNGDGELQENIKNRNFDQNGISYSKRDCVIIQKIGDTDWKLYTVVTGHYLRQRSGFVFQFFLISFLVAIVVILLTTSQMLEKMIQPITRLSRRMQNTEYDEFNVGEVVYTNDEIQTLYECYNNMVEEIQKGIAQKIEYEKKTKEMEFDIMMSQINPHYLYNVLHTVVYLSAMGRNKEVSTIINSLIFTLQETLKLGDKSIETTVEQELELTKCYLKIQEYRYPGMFEVQIECADSEKNCMIPKTIIQPLVENALLHGILPTEKPGIILIKISREKEYLRVEVTDNGEGISDERLSMFDNGEEMVYEKGERQHIGISNIRDRVRYLYGNAGDMWIEKGKEHGTRVILHVPL